MAAKYHCPNGHGSGTNKKVPCPLCGAKLVTEQELS
jgi:DnaJ-class molecular chaperone